MARTARSRHGTTARRVSEMLHDDERLGAAMPRHPNDGYEIVIAMPNERVGRVMSRISKIGIPVTVAVAVRRGPWLFTVRQVPNDARPHVHTDEDVVVHPNITVKMLGETIFRKGGSLLFHVAEPDLAAPVDYELVLRG